MILDHALGADVPYWIRAKIKESGFSVVVETAQDALNKMAELAELALTEVSAKDLSGNVVELAALQAEANQTVAERPNAPAL